MKFQTLGRKVLILTNFTAWANSVVGRYIDVDNWAGNQCWDLSQHWLTYCNGGVLWTQPSNFPGLAAGSWEVATGNTYNTTNLLAHVSVVPANAKGQTGDIPIWAYGSPDYPISHTAVLVEDWGGVLYCISQNSTPARPDLPGYSPDSSGPSVYQELSRAGLLGFLRPRATITAQGNDFTPITEEGFLLALSHEDQVEVRDNLRKLVELTSLVHQRTKAYVDSPISAVPKKTVELPFPKRGTGEDGKPLKGNTSVGTELGWQDANFIAVRKRMVQK